MDDRDAKLRRLEAVKRRVPALTASAFAGLLQEIEANGLPGLKQRKHIKECTAKQMQQHAAYGPMILSVSTPGAGDSQIELVMTNIFTMRYPFIQYNQLIFRALIKVHT